MSRSLYSCQEQVKWLKMLQDILIIPFSNNKREVVRRRSGVDRIMKTVEKIIEQDTSWQHIDFWAYLVVLFRCSTTTGRRVHADQDLAVSEPCHQPTNEASGEMLSQYILQQSYTRNAIIQWAIMEEGKYNSHSIKKCNMALMNMESLRQWFKISAAVV